MNVVRPVRQAYDWIQLAVSPDKPNKSTALSVEQMAVVQRLEGGTDVQWQYSKDGFPLSTANSR